MVANPKKQRLNIEYEILYNKNFNPKYEICVLYDNPEYGMEQLDDYFEIDPVDDYKKNELENNSDYSCHETRISVWDVVYNAQWLETKSPGFKIEKSIQLFQFDLGPGDWLEDYDKSKVGKLEITEVSVDELGLGKPIGMYELRKVKKHEELLEFDEAAEIYKKYGMDDDVIRVREEARNKVSQTVIHGDYVDDRDTTIQDSVVSRSNVGAGGDGDDLTAKLQQLAQMHRDGILSDEQFEAAKNKLLK